MKTKYIQIFIRHLFLTFLLLSFAGCNSSNKWEYQKRFFLNESFRDQIDKGWARILLTEVAGLKEIKFNYFWVVKVSKTVKKGDVSVVRKDKSLVTDFINNTNKIQTVLYTMPGYSRGKLILSEDFSTGFDNWMTEGKVTARIDEGSLLFESIDELTENPKGNIWWKVDVESPFIMEFDYKSLTENGLSMVFWNATEQNGSDVFSRKRTGRYEEYINEMQAYHVSFHRFGSGKSNLRKAPGFHLVSSVPDPIVPGDTLWHHITIASEENRQRIFVDGRLIHDFIDNGKPCLSEVGWQHSLPCNNTSSIPRHGAIGIRHTQKQKALYDNFKIYTLIKN